jgi:riboflavin-specific deaminase-like protein
MTTPTPTPDTPQQDHGHGGPDAHAQHRFAGLGKRLHHPAAPEQAGRAPKTSDELALERTRMAADRTLMAADRSLMAWVRTALSMISFGFTIYKLLQGFEEAGTQLTHASSPRAMGMFLTGMGTVRDDNPRLDVRHVPTSRQPMKIVVDSRLEIDLEAQVLQGAPTLIFSAVERPDKVRELHDRGCRVVCLPDPRGKVDLPACLAYLAGEGLNEIHVEAGHKLNGSLARAGLIDELLWYLAPSLLGTGLPALDLPAPVSLAQRTRLHFHDIQRIGPDVRLMAKIVKIGDKAP